MTVIRSLALGEVGVRHAWRVVMREATTGVLVGLLVASGVWSGVVVESDVRACAHRVRHDVLDQRASARRGLPVA